MVDKKYRAVYRDAPKYRVMFPDKWTLAEKHDTIQAAMSSVFNPVDYFVIETFPGLGMFPVYNENVKD